MENLGALAILLAFSFALYSVVASVAGKWSGRPFLVLSGERAVYCIWALITTASGILIYSLMQGDYRLVYVYGHSNRAMDAIYKFTSWWGGQEGSLLLWNWLLATYSVVVVYRNRRLFRDMMPYVTAILMTTQLFFLSLVTFIAQPFKVWMAGRGIFDAGDGQGLNPLLQYWSMTIHPPMLYLGFVGSVVPFAFAAASLITKQKGEAWIYTTRRWVLVTWMFQTTGILLGANWAYAALGWGGYWKWDPVENASLLPWITGTAYLHSVMMQEKKGMMKVWNIVLVSTTFFISIFGTFLTRSGVVNSVHAFATSSIGTYFVWFLAIGISATVFLILNRLDYLKSETPLESVLSRESSFFFNNLLLLASCFAVLWGTLFPVITEALRNEKISVDEPFFNSVEIPIGLMLLLLTGIGPLIAWRRSSFDSLKRAFLWPTLAGVVVAGILFATGVHHFYALMSLLLCTFVTATILIEFYKGSSAIRAKDGTNWITSMWELTFRNTRRYGGYLVHMGIVFMFIGFTGKAFDKDTTVEVNPGDHIKLGVYELVPGRIQSVQNENYQSMIMPVQVFRNGQDAGTIQPEHRFYLVSKQPLSEVGIQRRPTDDLYVVFSGMSNDGTKAVIQAYVFPLVDWIWVGYFVVLAGTLICLIPNKGKLVWPRTEVVGIAEKHAKV
jgi:cytochrome c-type biogenesis protein CcmF